jgi:hypothetical protein
LVHFRLLPILCLILHDLQAFLPQLCSFIQVLQCRYHRHHHHYLTILLHFLPHHRTHNLLHRSSYHCRTLHLRSSSVFDGFVIVVAAMLGKVAGLPFFIMLHYLDCSSHLAIFFAGHSAVLSVRLTTALDCACLEDYVWQLAQEL